MRMNMTKRLGLAAVALTVGAGLVQVAPAAGAQQTGRHDRAPSGHDRVHDQGQGPSKADYRRLIRTLDLEPEERAQLEQTLESIPAERFSDPDFRSDGYDLLTEESKPGCREGRFHVYRKSGLVQAKSYTSPMYLDLLGALRLPAQDALLNPDIPAPAYPAGTKVPVRRTLADSKTFWATDLSNLTVRPVDSTVVTPGHEDRRDAALTVMFGDSVGPYYGGLLADTIAQEPAWKNGHHDLFTVSIATSNQDSTSEPSTMTVGIGALNALRYAKVGKGGVREYVAAEVARTIQIRERLVIASTSPEDSRRTAMMSDAFAGYFLAHRKGAALGKRGLADAALSAFVRGDCSVTSATHEGTPAQRRRAFRWGVEQAERRGARIIPVQRLGLKYDVAEDDLL